MPVKLFSLALLTISINGDSFRSRLLRREAAGDDMTFEKGLGAIPENAAFCLTVDQCWQKYEKMDFEYMFVNIYPTKGCFFKNNFAYWGTGGTIEEMSTIDLPGIQERIWCDEDTEEPRAKPAEWPMAIPTTKPESGSPMAQTLHKPTEDSPTTMQPTVQPTSKPITDRPTKNPGRPVKDSPSTHPIPMLHDATEPASNQAAEGPTKEPIMEPVPAKNSISPSATPIADGYISYIRPAPSPTTISPHLVTDTPLIHSPSGPTEQPVAMPITDIPTKQPYPFSSPSYLPTAEMPIATPSNNPTTGPWEQPPSNNPTLSPSTSLTNESPMDGPTSKPSAEPYMRPTLNPATESPAIGQLSTSPTIEPSLTLTLTSKHIDDPEQGAYPSSNDVYFTVDFTPLPTAAPLSNTTEREGNSESSWTTVPMSPFILSLQTDFRTSAIDGDELTYHVATHLQQEIQARASSSEVKRVNVDVSPISQRRHGQVEGLAFASDSVTPKEHTFVVNGTVYFAGSRVPTTNELDIVTRKAFDGGTRNEFLHSLQNAEDAGLQSIWSISLRESVNDKQSGEDVASYLNTPADDLDVRYQMYFFAIVFGLGSALIALYVFKTVRGRSIERERKKKNDEKYAAAPALPRTIEVRSNSSFNIECF